MATAAKATWSKLALALPVTSTVAPRDVSGPSPHWSYQPTAGVMLVMLKLMLETQTLPPLKPTRKGNGSTDDMVDTDTPATVSIMVLPLPAPVKQPWKFRTKMAFVQNWPALS